MIDISYLLPPQTTDPAGNQLACSSHGCEIIILKDLSIGKETVSFDATQRLTVKQLPCKYVCFQSEDVLLTAGFESKPVILQKNSLDGSWRQAEDVNGKGQTY